MRRSLPAVLGATFLLAGCGSADTEGPTWPEPPPPATATTTAAPAELTVNEWAAVECSVDQFCAVNFRVTGMLLSDRCEFGLKDPAEPLSTGTHILTMYTEAEAGFTPGGKPYVFANPQAVMDESSAVRQPASYDQPCADNPAHAEHHYLLTGVDEGGHAVFADVFAIPADTTSLLFEGYRLPLPELNDDTGAQARQTPLNDAPDQPADTRSGSSAENPAETGASQDPAFPGRVEECGEHCQQNEIPEEPRDIELPYRCADSDLRVSDPAECLAPDPTPDPGTSTPPTEPEQSQPETPNSDTDFGGQLWPDCAGGSITDERLCSSIYEP